MTKIFGLKPEEALLVGGLVYFAFGQKINDALGGVANATQGLGSGIGTAGQGLGGGISTAAGGLGTGISEAGSGLGQGIGDFGRTAGNVYIDYGALASAFAKFGTQGLDSERQRQAGIAAGRAFYSGQVGNVRGMQDLGVAQIEARGTLRREQTLQNAYQNIAQSFGNTTQTIENFTGIPSDVSGSLRRVVGGGSIFLTNQLSNAVHSPQVNFGSIGRDIFTQVVAAGTNQPAVRFLLPVVSSLSPSQVKAQQVNNPVQSQPAPTVRQTQVSRSTGGTTIGGSSFSQGINKYVADVRSGKAQKFVVVQNPAPFRFGR